ncbi:MAG: prepilin-type N-terminal cleavage/methylation domain-containing protein [Patescibacteria group bacterium]
MIKNRKFIKEKNGYTLIELMLAISIFSIAVSICVNMFINAIKLQRSAIAVQNVSDNGRYIMEIIAREIRTGKVNSFILNGTDDLSFQSNSPNRAGNTLKFYLSLSGDQLMFDDNTADALEALSVTATNNVVVTFLRFEIQNSTKQPRITIFLNVQSKNPPVDSQDEIYLQTTISPRELRQ